MMVSIIPLIDERQGAIEREMVGGQLSDYAAETIRLAEAGAPSDIAKLELKPHTGTFAWSFRKGGTWYTASHLQNHSLRLDGAMDLDDSMQLRHPEGRTESICFSDLRASGEALQVYRIPALTGTIAAAPVASLQNGLQSTRIDFDQDGLTTTTKVNGLWTVTLTGDDEAWLNSSSRLRVLLLRGEGGQTIVPPDFADASGRGRAWTLPLPSGVVEISMVADQSNDIAWSGTASSGRAVAPAASVSDGSSGSTEASHWQWRGDVEAGVMHITSSAPSTLMLRWAGSSLSDAGDATLLDAVGSAIGERFLAPAANGSLSLHNPNTSPTSVRVEGFYHSIPARGDIRIPWTDQNRGWIVAASPISIHLLADADGDGLQRPGSLDLAHAADSGRTGGTAWDISAPTLPVSGNTSLHLQPLAPTAGYDIWADPFLPAGLNGSVESVSRGVVTSWAATVSGRLTIAGNDSEGVARPLRVYLSAGEDGLTSIPENGEERCLPLGQRITGWIDVSLPWKDVSFASDSTIRQAWRDGSHPFGLTINVRGDGPNGSNSLVATGWTIPLPRLSYTFRSSITGMEVATRGGFVGTNHPEFETAVIVPTPSREGPGPRLAATIPLIMPDSGSAVGGGLRQVELTLDHRSQLASMQAWQVRRGWDGPYGVAIADHAGLELYHSVDWLTHPGRLDLLDDHVGWVQTLPGSDESVYHAGGEVVSFNLQLAEMRHFSEVST